MATTTPAPTALDLYERLATRVMDVVEAADGARWSAPSPCPDWTATGVLDHLVDTQRDFLAQHDLDAGPRPDTADPARGWRNHVDAVTEVMARPGVDEQGFDGFFGPTTVGATLARFYGFDMVVHRWDLGRALGMEVAFRDDEFDLLEDSIAAFGDHLHADGVCGPARPIGDDATRQERILATTGRDPKWTTPTST